MTFEQLSSQFKNKKILNRAFIHRSYLNEVPEKKLQSNERLEFLGDAVLELIVSLYLYKHYPDFSEGGLTERRSKLVQTKTLALAANRLGLGQQLKLSRGEKASGGAENTSILADTFEAVIGAMHEDRGFNQTFKFVVENLLLPAEKLFSQELPTDYKSTLQELVQAKKQPSPTYQVVEALGPDHNKTFKIAVYVDNQELAWGVGKSKQMAEQEAAKAALENLGKNH